MKTKYFKFIMLFIAFTIFQTSLSAQENGTPIINIEPAAPNQVPDFVKGAPLTPAYVKAIGKIAYLWGWPLVNMQARYNLFSSMPHAGYYGGVLPVAPAGHVCMLTDYMAPEQRFVTSPNQDVVYGAGFFSLDKEPIVIQVPDFGDRFWVYQLVNQRTDEYGQFGRQYNTEPGHYLIVGPNWNGEVPKGINKVYRSATNISSVFPRVFMDDTDKDRKAIQPLINQVMAYPLSEYDGTMKTTDWKKTPTIEKKDTGSDKETGWVNPQTFFDILPSVLDEVKPLPGEEVLYSWFRFVLDAAKDNPELKKALVDAAEETEKDIITDMFEFRNNGVDAGNGWRTQFNAAEFGYGSFQRTATAKGNMFSNMAIETKYFGADFDSKGERLNSSKNYTVTFAKGELPPVRGFWSLTMYNKEHFFVKNKMERYSLGTKNKDLVYNKDGSLTLYIQPNSPGKSKEANWLPSPKYENFSIYIRAYWPDSKIVRGEWTPPVIRIN